MHENKSLVACKRLVKFSILSFLRQSEGQALIIVLLFTAFLLFIGGSTMFLAAKVKGNAAIEVRQARAAYIAEAGIEMVLAKAKNDPCWVSGLVIGQDYNFLGKVLEGRQVYGDGLLEEIKVCKLAENKDRIELRVSTIGNYKGSRHRLSAEAIIEPYSAGRLFQGMNTEFFPDVDGYFAGDIRTNELCASSHLNVKGSIYIKEKMTATGESHIIVNGDIYCLGNGIGDKESVALFGTVNVQDIYVQAGKVCIGDNVMINGKVYVNSEDQLNESWRQDHQDRWQVDPSLDFAHCFYPVFNFLSEEKLLWYKLNADYSLQGTTYLHSSDLQDLSGLYYVDGDLNLSGAYSGKAIFIVAGKATIMGDLYSKNKSEDCLALVTAQGFHVEAIAEQIEALLFSGERGSADGNGPLSFQGSFVVPEFYLSRTPWEFIYDEEMLENFQEELNWALCFAKIRKWSQ